MKVALSNSIRVEHCVGTQNSTNDKVVYSTIKYESLLKLITNKSTSCLNKIIKKNTEPGVYLKYIQAAN